MNKKYSQIIVDRILLQCRHRGITLYQLSIMSGVSHSTLDNLVNQKTFNPKIRTLHKIAIAFGMTLAEFLDFPELNSYSFDDEKEDEE
ncbi:MAG: helix-turn-helix domain-containing protein [Candidatus Limivicinus sp.]